MRDNRIVIVGIVIVILIAGVSIAFLGRSNDTGESNVVSVPVVSTMEEKLVVGQESIADAAVSATVTIQSESVVPTPRTDLEATDPSSVNLLSGNVQLVEAFAFW